MNIADVEPLTYNPEVAAKRIGISRATLDRLIADGEIRARRAGRRVLVSEASIQEFLADVND